MTDQIPGSRPVRDLVADADRRRRGRAAAARVQQIAPWAAGLALAGGAAGRWLFG
jgi:hypothetical protein